MVDREREGRGIANWSMLSDVDVGVGFMARAIALTSAAEQALADGA